MTLRKSKVTIAGWPLSAKAQFVWRFVGGVQPYQTVAQFHSSYQKQIDAQLGEPLRLEIEDARGKKVSVNQVYILHRVRCDSPNRVNYLISDKRWRWPYRLVARDYNIKRKTGNRSALGATLPQLQTVVDNYDFATYSLDSENGGVKWTAKRAVEDCLSVLEGPGVGAGGFRIESFPIEREGADGEFTLQDVTLRDPGDVALSRLLSYVPGADVYINKEGQAIVRDATDMRKTEEHMVSLEDGLRAHVTGDVGTWVDRKVIRPKRVFVYYQRELEVLFSYSDDYSGEASQLSRSAPFVQNVMQSVEDQTVVNEYDPETGLSPLKVVPPGTFVDARSLMDAWNSTATTGPNGEPIWPFQFSTFSYHWLQGDMEAFLGGNGRDKSDTGLYVDINTRVNMLRQHWRQTFRVNRRYTERVKEFKDIRAGLLDPITGARQPAAVWSQTCAVMNDHSQCLLAGRGGSDEKGLAWRNLDYTRESREDGVPIIQTSPAPCALSFISPDIGVFRIDWLQSRNAVRATFSPGMTLGISSGEPQVPTVNLALQDSLPIVANAKVETAGSLFLDPRMYAYFLFTIVPAGPNNLNQFHREEVTADDVGSVFRSEFRIKKGDGPDLHVFVPPGELTARYAWAGDEAYDTIQDVLGLTDEEGVQLDELPGYTLVNRDRAIRSHAISTAAELMSEFADGAEGSINTVLPDEIKLVGNMDAVSVRVGGGESGKVDVEHTFVGRQRRVSRLAFLPESARQVIYGTLK